MKKLFSRLILLLAALAGSSQLTQARPIKGSATAAGQPLQGVILSDGATFARTDADGHFEMELADDAPFVWAVTPSGYTAPYDHASPQFYLPTDGRDTFDFSFTATPQPFMLLAVGDTQPKTAQHFKRMKKEEMPDLQATVRRIRSEGGQPALLLLGDIVWDSPELLEPLRETFAKLGAPVYTLIGNHDHLMAESQDFASTANYRRIFGPTYYAFDMGDTHFVVLDNILYYGHRKYDEGLDNQQLEWLEGYLKLLPAGSRICVAMHAPLQKYWMDNLRMKNGSRLIELLAGHEVHFITGHTHINSNLEVASGMIEHNVAQISGNLWRAPLNNDGTPRGYQLFYETDKGLEWRYKALKQKTDYQIIAYAPGRVQNHENEVIAKVWNWDTAWRVEWTQDGQPMGAMTQLESLPDPDYAQHIASLTAKAAIKKAKKPKRDFQPARFYFSATPAPGTRLVEIIATDRFGHRFTERVKISK